MSLMERVRSAGLDDGAPQATVGSTDDLRAQVNAMLSPERLAQLASSNPRQAENEIRNACERAFANNPWLASTLAERQRLVEALVNDVFGLGALEPFLADEGITEIMVNGTHSLYVERNGVNVACPLVFADDEAVRALIDRILGPLGRRIDEANPMVDARLPSGHRVNAVIPPIAIDGPVLTIRKFSRQVIGLEQMEQTGSLERTVRMLLEWAVLARKNIAVSGGTGSGKTTLLNALSCKVPHRERIVTIEDSAELRFLEHPHVVRLEARPENAEGKGEITIRDLVKNALRMRPDRIIVGECRGGEALDMLTACNTGHAGSLTTLHANNPDDAVLRLTTMVRFAADLPVDVIEAQIASAFDLVVQVQRQRNGSRHVAQIAEVLFDRVARACRLETLYYHDAAQGVGEWVAPPSWIDEAVECGLVDRGEVEAWMLETHLWPSAA